MNVHGIIFDDEHDGQPVNYGGLDWSRCEYVLGPERRNPDERPLSDVRGKIVEIRAIYGIGSCTSDADRGLLDLNRGRPVLRATAILDERLFPGVAEFVNSRQLRWAAEGHITEKLSGGIARATVNVVRLGSPPNLPTKFRVFPGLG
jgi:hypothetical protein